MLEGDLGDLAGLIESFLERRKVERLSAGHVASQRRALSRLLSAVRARLAVPEGRPIPVSAVTLEDLLCVLAWLFEHGRANSTVSAHASAFRLFFDDLALRGLLFVNPADRLPSISDDGLPRDVPSHTQMRRLLEMPDTRTDVGTRDRALLEVLYGSGLRSAEVVALDVSDVNLADATAFIKDGKGGKDRVVPLTGQAVRWITAYLSRRPPSSSPRLFLDAHGKRPLRRQRLRKTMRELFRQAGLKEEMTVHAIRHACALHLLEGGADLISIRNLLGHASVDTTAVYLKLTTAHLQRELERAHPREREDAREAAREAAGKSIVNAPKPGDEDGSKG